MKWRDAAVFCRQRLNSSLVMILNEHEDNALTRYLSQFYGQ